MLRSDAPSHTLPVLPLRVVPQSDFIIARCKSILCTRSWVTGESLVERFVDQAVNPGYMRCFCRKCGSAVPRLNRTKQYYVVPAGLLDADPIVKPERSVYWDDRAPWLINIDGIPKLSEELDSIMREQARNDFPGTYPPEI
jgi:Glutathione-dependent formaldehyde-activating enzyme